ncbi:MAG: PaaI family thioesterase [Actinomycetia bacterium]|nr:PaaI family thioesterase [Actinomycetes bacterium]MCP4962029.1 PaaI family thioesterase [Actinomycetes bacterium]
MTSHDPFLDAARIAAADRVRDVTHALMGHEQDPLTLDKLVRSLDELLPELVDGPRNKRSLASFADERLNNSMPDDEAVFPLHLERPVSGAGNPWSIPLTVVRRGDRAVSTVLLREAFEGAPGRSHGGVVAAIFDDLCGYVLSMTQTMAFTAWLRIEFLHGTPLGHPITFSTWLDRQEGRKLFIEGECADGERHDGDNIVTRCHALFIIPPGVPID